jgi:hypothetical protein
MIITGKGYEDISYRICRYFYLSSYKMTCQFIVAINTKEQFTFLSCQYVVLVYKHEITGVCILFEDDTTLGPYVIRSETLVAFAFHFNCPKVSCLRSKSCVQNLYFVM